MMTAMTKYARRVLGWTLSTVLVTLSGGAFAVNQAPVATMIAPADGTLYSAPATISLSATASDPDGSIKRVEFYAGNSLIGVSSSISNPYVFTWTGVSANANGYSVTAKAIDNLDKAGSSSPIQIRVVTPTTVIATPQNGATVPVGSTSVNGTITASGIASVIVTAGGVSRAASVSGNSFYGDAVIQPGLNIVEIQVARGDGTAEITTIQVTGVRRPSIVLTDPLFRGPYTRATTVTIAADVVGFDSPIQSIQFFEGSSTPLSTITTPPYSLSYRFADVYGHSFWARATDQRGLTADSNMLQVLAGGGPPAVTITSPASGSIVRPPASISLAVNASDPDGNLATIQYYANGSPISQPLAAPYAFTWANVPAANYSLSAVATDDMGNTGFSASVNVSVASNLLPTVSITSPTINSSFNAPANITATITASDNDGSIAKVELLVDGQAVAQTTTGATPYSLAWASATAGSHSLTARATDNDGGVSVSAPVSVTVNGVTATISSPQNNSIFGAPAAFAIQANAATSSGTVTSVEFYDGATKLATMAGGAQTVTATLNLSGVLGGTHIYSVVARDSATRSGTSNSVSVMVLAPPAVALTAPANNSSFLAPAAIGLSATASGNGSDIAKVDFFQGSTLVGTAQSAPYTFNWTNVGSGTYTITAKATDLAGSSSTSGPVTITVANTIPTVTLVSPGPNALFAAPANVGLTANANGNGTAIAQVEFFAGSTRIAVDTSAPYSATWTGVPAGAYLLTAKVTDVAGTTATTASTTINVVNTLLTLDSPMNGAAIASDRVLVSGTIQAPPNSGVSVNGQAAAIDNNGHYYVTVPIAGGANTLTATLTTPDGGTLTQSSTVNGNGVVPAIVISASPVEGVNTLVTTAQVTNGADTSVSVEINGGSVGTVAPGQAATFTISYGGAGTFPLSITASDAQANTVSASYVVVVHDQSALDSMFRERWTGMTQALLRGDKTTALSYLSPSAQLNYGPVFDALAADFGQILPTWSQPALGSISPSIAEYAIAVPNGSYRGLFLVYFLRGTDGVWRLESM